MATSETTVEIVRLHQPAAALSNDLTINVGWRPMVALVFNYGADEVWAFACDLTDPAPTAEEPDARTAQTGPTGGLLMAKDDAQSAALGNTGITFHANGIKLGQHTALVKDNNANIIVVLIRSLTAVKLFDLAKVPTIKKAFGDGKQFSLDDGAYDPQLADQVTVVKSA